MPRRNKTLRRRKLRGGGCGCGGKPFFGGRRGRRTRRVARGGGGCQNNIPMKGGCAGGGIGTCGMHGGGRRRRMRGGGMLNDMFDPILGRVFSSNPVGGFNSTGSMSAPNLVYGSKYETGNPTHQPVNFYGKHNPQMA